MSEEGKIEPKSILNKIQNADSEEKKDEKKISQSTSKVFERKEPMAGILRVDCSKPRRNSGGSVDFAGLPNRLATQAEPPSPQPSVDRLSVTFAEKSDCSDSSVKINVFDPGSPPSTKVEEMEKLRFRNNLTDGEEDEEEDDYSASVSVIMQRRESMKRPSSKRRKRRVSSPLPDVDGSFFQESRRRSSEYTNSSGDTAISIENETTQEQIFENIRLHKEVLSNVKFQPWGMRKKIKLVQQAKAYVKRHEGELQERLAMSKSTKDILARFNIWLIKKLRFLKRELANTMTLLIPWELRIKEIESHFGSAVASYFTFLRWMFWVNLVITIVLACFVAIPEMLTADVKSAGERKEMLPEEKLTATNLVTLWDFGGVLKYSPIFYGYYTNRDKSGTGYRLPFAYFMTGLAVYVYSFVATLRRMAENSRMSKLSEKDDECIFTWKIFTGWDYMIGNAETAHNRVASLILGFKEALLEETERKKDEKNWKVICLRVLVSFVVIGLLVFSAYIVFVVVERSTQPEANSSWWRQNEITVSVSIISLLFPFCFELLGLLEGYHPRKSLRIQLARIMVLNLLNLYTLIFSQFWKISDMTIELQNLKSNYTLMFPSTVQTVTMEVSAPICVLIAINCTSATVTTTAATATTTTATTTTTTTAFETSNHPSITLTPSSGFFNFTMPPELNNSTESFADFVNSTEFFSGETNGEPFYYNITGFTTEDAFNVSAGSINSTEATDSTTVYSSFNDLIDSSSTEHGILSMEDSSMGSAETSGSPSTEMTFPFGFFVEFDTTSPRSDILSSNASKRKTGSDSDFSAEKSEREEEFDVDGKKRSIDSADFRSEEDLLIDAKANGGQGPSQSICFVKKCEEDENRTREKEFHPFYDTETRKRLRSLCWETMFGQELVKLTVMDLILTILSVLLLDFFRAIFVRVMNNCWCWDLEKKFPQYGDFKIAENILHLVYNQGMVWMGMFFSPGLPAINLIKLAIMMYLRSWAVLTCNVPHEVVFRASRSNNFYLALLLTMLFLCVLPVGFAIVWIEPSWHCGPFSDYKRIYHLFTKTLQKALPKTLHKAFDYVASPGIIIPLLMLLVLIIYYLISLTNSLREANNDLKTQLRRERTEERRKMFQMVNKRARKESKDSEMPFAKWKKLVPELAAKQLALANDLEKGEKHEGETNGDSKKEINRKELLARLMKKALGKSPATTEEKRMESTEEEENRTSRPGTSFVFEEKELNLNPIQKNQHSIDRQTLENSNAGQEVEEREAAPAGTSATAKAEGSSVRRPRGNSQPENIPVIKISKIESEDQAPKKEGVRETEKETGKVKFISAVKKSIKNSRREKADLEKETKTQNAGDEESEKETKKIREEDEERYCKRCPIAKEEIIPSELFISAETS